MSTASADGTLSQVGDRWELRFERRLDFPVEEVFDAITKPDRLALWIGTARHELREGGRFWLRFDKTMNNVVEGTITRYEPPTLFEHTFESPEGADDPAGLVRWELRPDGDGCVLVLTHALDDPKHGSSALSGWDTLLENLPDALAGRDTTWTMERWSEVHDQYAARYGGPSAAEMQSEM
jgi:uncharacterized protein YndB with AHSA1/START domain